jgi:two-component system, NarL family, response regulator LiaR
MIRLIVVDDHLKVHQGIAAIIDAFDDLEIVGHASNGQEAISLIYEQQPDLVLMDVVMPVMSGIEATRRIHATQPHVKILALSSFQDTDSVREMLNAGAVGYVLKNASIDDLAHTVRAAHSGKVVLSPEVSSMLLHLPAATSQTRSADYGLTQREREILGLVVSGRNNGEIAAVLTISLSTVKFHVSSIFGKLGVTNRVEAARLAMESGLLE